MRHHVIRPALFSLPLAMMMAAGVAGQESRPSGATPHPPRAAAAADNLRDFEFVTEKIRLNYAGWDTKVTAETSPALEALTERLRAEVDGATAERMAEILGEWLAFFADRHIGIRPLGPADGSVEPDEVPTLDWTEADVRARLEALGEDRDPLEGIWRINDRYRVGVLRDPAGGGTFPAVVLSTEAETWSPGQVKAELRRASDGSVGMLFRAGDRSEHQPSVTAFAGGAVLRMEGFGCWIREHPAPSQPLDARFGDRVFPSTGMFIEPLSETTLWLRLPDFDPTRAEALAKLLTAAADRLSRVPNLLIDLRDNGGGSDFVYEPLLPIIASRPIYGIGVELRASDDNIALRAEVADSLRAKQPDVAEFLDGQIARMRANPGGYVAGDTRPFSIMPLDAVRPFPRRVAVLIDGAGSSGEQFILAARQSRKVTLFGRENSAGVLDFANVVGMTTPSGRFHMFWATSRSLRLPDDPVDPHGIAPDVRIPADAVDPIGFVTAWLERQADDLP